MPEKQGIMSVFEKATGSKDSSTNIRAQGQGSSHPEPCWNVSSQGPGDGNSGFRQGGSWESKELEGGKEDRKQRSAELGSWRLLNLLPQPGTLLRYPCCGPADQACGSHAELVPRDNSWRPHPAVAIRMSQDPFLLLCPSGQRT